MCCAKSLTSDGHEVQLYVAPIAHGWVGHVGKHREHHAPFALHASRRGLALCALDR